MVTCARGNGVPVGFLMTRMELKLGGLAEMARQLQSYLIFWGAICW